MAEQVSVRLAVVGGTQFRNELSSAGRDGSQAMDRIATSSRKLGPQVQNASYQIGDFAVQVASGQSATRAFAQQMPQLLGGFGVVGAVAGAAVAVMAALAPLFFKNADGAAEMAKTFVSLEGSISGVDGAVSSLESIQRQYNEAISQTGAASSSAAALVIANSKAEFAARKELLGMELELLRIRGGEMKIAITNSQDAIDRQYNGFKVRLDDLNKFDPTNNTSIRDVPGYARGSFTKGIESEFSGQIQMDVLAVRKLRAEYDLTSATIERTSKLMDTEFKDITTGGTGKTKTTKGGGGAAKASKEQNTALKEQQKLFDETRTKAERYAIELDKIDALYKSGAISTEVYQRKMAQLKKEYETQGAFAASVATTLKSTMDSLFDSMFEGGNKAAEAVGNLGKKLAAMAAQQATYQLLAKLMPATFGAGGFIPLLPNANGNAFSGGRVTAFASGGVVSSATMFPMRSGMGLMGEAGPEAIMPLTRIGGKLGVRAGGSGGAGTVVQVIDQRQNGAPIREERSRGPNGREMVKLIVGEEMARGSFDRSQNGRYGATPKKVKR